MTAAAHTVTYRCPCCPTAFAVAPAPFPVATACYSCGGVAAFVDGVAISGVFIPFDSLNNSPVCDVCVEKFKGQDVYNHHDVCDGSTPFDAAAAWSPR